MSGLYALFLLLLWCSFLGWLCWRFAKPRFKSPMNGLVAYGLFLVLIPLPVIDEIVGAWQMNRLCEANAHYRLGVADPAGRTTRYQANPPNEIVEGTITTILHTRSSYIDVATNETVVEFDEYAAKGGLLVRLTFPGFPNRPAVGKASCSPTRGKSPTLTFDFKVIN